MRILDERLIGEVGDRFEYNRIQRLQSVGKNAPNVVPRHDRERESERATPTSPPTPPDAAHGSYRGRP